VNTAVQQFTAMLRTFTLRLFCEKCGKETVHRFLRDSGIFEIYECSECATLNKYAVR